MMKTVLILFLLLSFTCFFGCGAFDKLEVFKRNIDGYELVVRRGLREEGGETFELLVVKLTKDFELMSQIRSFQLPRSGLPAPEFKHVETDSFFCLFDCDNLGFLVLVDIRSKEYFVTSSQNPRGELSVADFEKWKTAYQDLKAQYPELPYTEYFRTENG